MKIKDVRNWSASIPVGGAHSFLLIADAAISDRAATVDDDLVAVRADGLSARRFASITRKPHGAPHYHHAGA